MRIAIIFATLALPLTAAPLTLHVSPNGSDTNDGRSQARAFATLERARDEARVLRARGWPAQGVVIELAAGRHVRTAPLELSAEDSGKAGAPLVLRGPEKGAAIVAGGLTLPIAQFATVTRPEWLERLPPEARGRVRSLGIETLGLSHAGPFPQVFSDSGGLFEVFADGRRLPLARWPNEGWTTMKRVLVNGEKNVPGVFEYRDDRPERWLNNSQLWLKGQWRVGWEDPAIRVAAIDPVLRTITFAAGIPNGIGNKYTRPAGNGAEPWFALNLPEEIDLPGEWAVDFATKTLLIWPPDGAQAVTVSQVSEPLIRARDTAHVRFTRLTLEHSLGDGFHLENTDGAAIEGCEVRLIAGNAIVFNGRNGSVRSNDLHLLGAGGILVSGGVSRTLEPSNIEVVNNHIHNYGAVKAMYSAAVDVGTGGVPNGRALRDAVGVRVAHNLIHDAPRDAILVSGQEHVFELNEITRCGFGSADVGAFYSWLDWTIRGVVIRHNLIRDSVGGVNPDDGSSGFTVHGNIFAGPRTGVWIASGPDHTIENNIFIKDEGPVFGMDDRGATRGYLTNKRLLDRVAAMRMNEPPWSERYPGLAEQLADRPDLPKRTLFARNLIVIGKGVPVQLKFSRESQNRPGLLTQLDNWVTAEDPGFVDAKAGNYALRADSPAFERIPGFKTIPFERIGLHLDEFRRALPARTEAGAPNPDSPQPDQQRNFGT